MKNQKKIEFAQYNVERANADIAKLKLDLKRTNITEAETKAINSRIAKIESTIAKDKAILRNSNYKIAAQKTLPDAGIAYGTYYLAGAKPQTAGTIAMTDEDAQMFGFSSAAEMEEFAKQNNMTLEQLAQYITNEYQKAQAQAEQGQQPQTTANYNTAAQYTSNPYMQYGYMQAPAGNMLGFNELYVSPYPEMI